MMDTKKNVDGLASICTIARFEWLSFLFWTVIVTCPVMGQMTSKMKLTPKDYSRWSTLSRPQISNDGLWVSFAKQYDYGADTLFVQSTIGNKKYLYPGNGKLEFSDDAKKVVIHKDSLLMIQDLSSGEVEKVSPIIQYEPILNGEFLLIRKHSGIIGKYDLTIKELDGSKEFELYGIDHFVRSPNGNSLLILKTNHESHTLHMLDLTKEIWNLKLLTKSKFPLKQLVWGPSGKSIAFMRETIDKEKEMNLFFYKLFPKLKMYQMDPKIIDNENNLIKLSDSKLIISYKDQRVFFKAISELVPRDTVKDAINDQIVEIWHSNDRIIFPRKKKLGLDSQLEHTWVWWPGSNKFLQLGSAQQPDVIITPDYNHSISYNLLEKEPQYKRNPNLDIYITEIETGKKQLLAPNITFQGKYFSMSESGNFIKYFKHGDWWVYNIKKYENVNLTKGLETEWFYNYMDNVDNATAYGSPGWAVDGKSIIVYDRYDLWQISLDGKMRKRLTHGAEKGIVYRIYKNGTKESNHQLYPVHMESSFNLDKELILEGRGDDLSTGYFLLEPKLDLKTLIYKPKKVHRLKKAKMSNDYICLIESFENPTQLLHFKAGEDPSVIADPNFFQSEYSWGKSLLLDYQNKKGEELKGVLIYPANYKPGHKYPMVVHVYEVQHERLNKAVVPTEFIKSDYLNPSIFASNGYFVLYPDIKYSIGETGESALECVTASVEKVIDMGLVDSNKIGLYGASFGGYETAYIVSQTDVFASAIIGSALIDLVRSYLSIDENSGEDKAWLFENHQMRMGSSFTKDFEKFVKNSPIQHIANISTPILGWVGKEDRHVHWTQSVELYLALRRYQKEHVLLVYPGEAHNILNKDRQKDLTKRIIEWMDHYLRGMPKKSWMVE